MTASAVRVATLTDASAIVDLVNRAFQVESFFKAGDRTDIDEIRERFATGEFLIVEESNGGTVTPVACVYLTHTGAHAHFGMLSIEPAYQGRGLGRRMIDAIESRCREYGCTDIEIHVVDLRLELPPFYRRFGFVETERRPYPDDGSATRPCHFIVMQKTLT